MFTRLFTKNTDEQPDEETHRVKSNVSFKDMVSSLISCLKDWSIDVNGVLKLSTMTVFLSISPFLLVNLCFMYLGASMLSTEMFTRCISSCWIHPFIIRKHPCFSLYPSFKFFFFDNYWYLSFFSHFQLHEIIFSPHLFTFNLCVFQSEVGLL